MAYWDNILQQILANFPFFLFSKLHKCCKSGNLSSPYMLISMRLSGYCLARRSSFSSTSLLSLFSFLGNILTILKLKEYGMDLVVFLGWQLDGNRYWFLSVFFLSRSIYILLFSILIEVSKNGIDSVGCNWKSDQNLKREKIENNIMQIIKNLCFVEKWYLSKTYIYI